MSASPDNPKDIEFTKAQLEWLEKVFPENTETTDPGALQRAAGIRHVVKAVRGRVRIKSNLG